MKCGCDAVHLNGPNIFVLTSDGKTHTDDYCFYADPSKMSVPLEALTAAPVAKCVCPIKDLTSTGHNAGCPEKKR